MKKIRIFLFFVLLTFGVTLSAMGPGPSGKHDGGCVHVPLDGGLLTVLGAAGVVYFVARKKNRKKE